MGRGSRRGWRGREAQRAQRPWGTVSKGIRAGRVLSHRPPSAGERGLSAEAGGVSGAAPGSRLGLSCGRRSPSTLPASGLPPGPPPRVSGGAGARPAASRVRGPGAGWSAGRGGAVHCPGSPGVGPGSGSGSAVPGAGGKNRELSTRVVASGTRPGGPADPATRCAGRGARGVFGGGGVRAGHELSAARPQGLLPPGGDQDVLGGARRVPGPAARGLGRLWRRLVSAGRAGRQGGWLVSGWVARASR